MTTQLDLFGEAKVTVGEPEPMTEVKLGRRSAQIPLRRKRRDAIERFCALLDELEGTDIYIGWCGGSRSHFWMNNVKLGRLRVEKGIFGKGIPSIIVLWGNRGGSVRIFTEQVIDLREQDYQGYTLWLLAFWNGFGEYPLDQYKPTGYESLDIVRFKD